MGASDSDDGQEKIHAVLKELGELEAQIDNIEGQIKSNSAGRKLSDLVNEKWYTDFKSQEDVLVRRATYLHTFFGTYLLTRMEESSWRLEAVMGKVETSIGELGKTSKDQLEMSDNLADVSIIQADETQELIKSVMELNTNSQTQLETSRSLAQVATQQAASTAEVAQSSNALEFLTVFLVLLSGITLADTFTEYYATGNTLTFDHAVLTIIATVVVATAALYWTVQVLPRILRRAKST